MAEFVGPSGAGGGGEGLPYTVTFDPNGGTGTMSPFSITAFPYTLPLNTITYTGFLFTGWNTEVDGSGVAVADGSTFSSTFTDYTLYAQWFAEFTPPSSPFLLTPANGSALDATLAIIFSANYNSTDFYPQNAYTMRLRVGTGAYGYWNGTDFSSTIPVWNFSAVAPATPFSVVIPGGVIANGVSCGWSFASQELGANLQGVFAPDFSFTTAAAPVATLTGPGGTATIPEPTVAWTEVLGAGVQIAYRVVVESGAYGTVPGSGTLQWDSDVVPSVALFQRIGASLISGTYRIFLQITQTDGLTSAWVHDDCTVTVTPPAMPTAVASMGLGALPNVQLVVGVGAYTSGPYVGSPLYVIARRSDGSYVRGASPTNPFLVTAASVALTDTEVPTNIPITYSVYVEADTGFGMAISAAVTSNAITSTSNKWWIWPPNNFPMAVTVNRAGKASTSAPASGGDASLQIDRDEDQGQFLPFGRPDTLVVHGDLRSERFSLTLVFTSDADWEAFDAIRNLQGVVAVRSDMRAPVYFMTMGAARPVILLHGDRLHPDGPVRQVTMDFIPSARPAP